MPVQALSRFYPVLACFQDIVRRGEIIDNDMEDEFYLRRLDAGLFILQHICYIMAEICNANVPQVGGLPGSTLSVVPSPMGGVRMALYPGDFFPNPFFAFLLIRFASGFTRS